MLYSLRYIQVAGTGFEPAVLLSIHELIIQFRLLSGHFFIFLTRMACFFFQSLVRYTDSKT